MKGWIFSKSFVLINFLLKIKNFNKPKLLIYTDSRGFDVIGKKGKNPINSYVQYLALKYRVTYFICPEKYTTIIDFLNQLKKFDTSDYDYIIMHCGIVDFSPRPVSNMNAVRESKKDSQSFNDLFEKNTEYYKRYLGPKYKTEELTTLYSKEFFSNQIIPELKKIDSLLWVNSNHFVKGWDGNYVKGRPENIDDIVSIYESLLSNELQNIVDIKDWNDENIKRFTIDNIHFTKEGFKKVYQLIERKLKELA